MKKGYFSCDEAEYGSLTEFFTKSYLDTCWVVAQFEKLNHTCLPKLQRRHGRTIEVIVPPSFYVFSSVTYVSMWFKKVSYDIRFQTVPLPTFLVLHSIP